MAKNKGEWSEAYALLTLLSEGKVPVAYLSDEKRKNGLRPLLVSAASLTVDKLRIERSAVVTYTFIRENGNLKFLEICFENQVIQIPAHIVTANVEIALNAIKLKLSDPSVAGSFDIPEAESILTKLYAGNGKTKSTLKQDVEISALDACGIALPFKGYSVKSYVGGAPTLFNAAKSGRFRYRIDGSKYSKAIELEKNTLTSKPKDWLARLIKDLDQNGVFNGSIVVGTEKEPDFERNLSLLDSQMGLVLGRMLLQSYITGDKNFASCLEYLIQSDPMDLGKDARVFYTYRVRHFLRAAALGFTAKIPWDGNEGAEGGMLILDQDCSLCCFASGKSEFEDYLIHSCKFDTPSSGRHKFGNIYRDEKSGAPYIDLVLQVRENYPF